MKIVEKPWGREIWVAHTDKYAFKIIEIKKGTRSSLQYHVQKHEHLYVDSGLLQMEWENDQGQMETLTLRPGEALCVVSDGVTEALAPSGELFGNARLERVLLGLRDGARAARAIVDGVCDGVATFVAGAEASDDLTVLVLRWRGRDAGAT